VFHWGSNIQTLPRAHKGLVPPPPLIPNPITENDSVLVTSSFHLHILFPYNPSVLDLKEFTPHIFCINFLFNLIILYVSILFVTIYICLVIYLTFNKLISISKIQVPLFMATCFGNKYHVQAIFKCLSTNRK
jgi:small basic protein